MTRTGRACRSTLPRNDWYVLVVICLVEKPAPLCLVATPPIGLPMTATSSNQKLQGH